MKRLLCLLSVFALALWLTGGGSSAFAAEQWLSADWHGETGTVMYLPYLPGGEGEWDCSGDEMIVRVTAEAFPAGLNGEDQRAKHACKISMDGVAPGFSFVRTDLRNGENLIWRYWFFVEVDERLNVIIHYSELMPGEGDISGVSVDYGTSERFSREEMEEAVSMILEEFRTWEGYTLYEISYGSDERSLEEFNYYAHWKDRSYSDGIVFDSVFLTPMTDHPDMGFSARNIQSGYNWILLRTENGPWEIVTSGY